MPHLVPIRRLGTAVLLTALTLSLAARTGGAVTSYQGLDLSYDYGGRMKIANCDRESDSVSTKAIYDFTTSGSSDGNVSDQDGSNGVCATRAVSRPIRRHRTCENPNWWPDECGNWKAT